MANIQVTCPTCQEALEIDARFSGQEVECCSCFQAFVAKKSTPPRDEDEEPKRRSGRKRSRRQVDDDDDDIDGDYDDRPRRRRSGGYVSSRARVVYIILAVFLGHFGAHNFYAGRTGSAVGQLALFIVSCLLLCVGIGVVGLIAGFVWWVIDAITVERDGSGELMA